MTRHLHELNIETTIFTTPHKYREELADEWMVELAGTKFKKVEVRSLSSKWTRKIGIGDLGLRWIPFLFPKLLLAAIKNKPDFILYPVPPWYLLLIAPIIKTLTGIPYGIDFIDPWVEGGKLPASATLKRKISQSIARNLEGWVCRNAAVIYSVSEGINKELILRHPKLSGKPMFPIPYGVEPGDFDSLKNNQKEKADFICLRHIGAVSDDAYPVIDTLFKKIQNTSLKHQLKIEFIGSSYAGKGLAQPQLDQFITKNQLNTILTENPNRVSYRKAVELTLTSDILILFGGMQPYYAASKLMGLIASQKPFIAFLHRETFPCKFLEQFNYPYLIKYSHHAGDLPADHAEELGAKFSELCNNYVNFAGLNVADERIQRHTALGMTKQFIEPINELLSFRK